MVEVMGPGASPSFVYIYYVYSDILDTHVYIPPWWLFHVISNSYP